MKMPKLRLEIFLSPIISILAAFFLGAILMLLFNKDPLAAYYALLKGAFGSKFAISNTISNLISSSISNTTFLVFQMLFQI